MVMGFAPTWLRQVSPLLHKTTLTTAQFQGQPLQRGREIHGLWENWRFSTEISVYLGNGARLADDYLRPNKLLVTIG